MLSWTSALTTNEATRSTSFTVTPVGLLHPCIPGSGKPIVKPSSCSPHPTLPRIWADYIPIWVSYKQVRVLIVNGAAALADKDLSGQQFQKQLACLYEGILRMASKV